MQFIKTFWLPIIIILVLVDFTFFRYLLRYGKGIGVGVYFWIILIALEYYTIQAIKVISNHNKWALIGYIVITLLMYGTLLYFGMNGARRFGSPYFKYLVIMITLFIVPKIFLTLAMILEDVFRIGSFSLKHFLDTDSETIQVPARRKIVSLLALGIASIPFVGVLYGIIWGKYNYRVIKQTIFFDDLPEEFDGFTITQISDLHSGSFDNEDKVAYGIQMATEQNSDILVFTGDIVNNHSDELEPWVETFSNLKAPMGMFSVFGNHDYGDYGNLSDEEKLTSQNRIKELQKQMGFHFLSNENFTFERGGKKLNIIGVENFGASLHFPRKGDLNKAAEGIKDCEFNVLLSHDPSHWDHDLEEYTNVLNFDKKIHLTLSGHTHGMQFGIEIPGLIKWSPVQYRYHNWAGLYEQRGKYLYVNRGFGYLAFPGRVGIWPEITVLELRRKV